MICEWRKTLEIIFEISWKRSYFWREIALHKGQKVLSANLFLFQNSNRKHQLNLQIRSDHTILNVQDIHINYKANINKA